MLIVLGAWAGPARATEVGYQRQYGVGVMLGDPTGLHGQGLVVTHERNRRGPRRVRLGTARRLRPRRTRARRSAPTAGTRSTISVHADYLWESKIIEGRLAQLDWHIGGGARALFVSGPCAGDCWDLGARAPVGLDLTFQQPTFLEVFLELAPAFYVVPVAFVSFEGALGVRGYF